MFLCKKTGVLYYHREMDCDGAENFEFEIVEDGSTLDEEFDEAHGEFCASFLFSAIEAEVITLEELVEKVGGQTIAAIFEPYMHVNELYPIPSNIIAIEHSLAAARAVEAVMRMI